MAGVAIVGAGRVGLTLGRALRRSGNTVHLLTRTPRVLVDGLVAETDWAAALEQTQTIILAVPDDAIMGVATDLAATGRVSAKQVVVHCSGLHDKGALSPLVPTGAAVGSFHPLQTFPDSSGNPERLHSIPVIIEGDVRATLAIRALLAPLGIGEVFELVAGGKEKYHAAAVFASNYLVVLAAIAQRLVSEIGISAADARSLFAPIMQETVKNLAQRSPGAVLTGPVVRGDRGTIAAHEAVLDGRVLELYKLLAEEAGRIVREK